jgi:hypothetical protein
MTPYHPAFPTRNAAIALIGSFFGVTDQLQAQKNQALRLPLPPGLLFAKRLDGGVGFSLSLLKTVADHHRLLGQDHNKYENIKFIHTHHFNNSHQPFVPFMGLVRMQGSKDPHQKPPARGDGGSCFTTDITNSNQCPKLARPMTLPSSMY